MREVRKSNMWEGSPRTERQILAAKKAQINRFGGSTPGPGHRKTCKKGKSCGAACIPGQYYCMVDLPMVFNPMMTALATTIQGRHGSTPPAPPTRSTTTTRPAAETRPATGSRPSTTTPSTSATSRATAASRTPAQLERRSTAAKIEKFWDSHGKIRRKMLAYAKAGMSRYYNREERKLLRLEELAGKRNDIKDRAPQGYSPTKKREMWNAETMRQVLQQEVSQHARSGNRAAYIKAEKELAEHISKYGSLLGASPVVRDREWGANREVRLARRRRNFMSALAKLQDELEKHARSGNRKAYDKVEKKILKVLDKGADKYRVPRMAPGEVWRRASTTRETNRKINYRNVEVKLRKELENAALQGNRQKYDEIEKKYMKVLSRAGARFGASPYERGGIWNKTGIERRTKGFTKVRSSLFASALQAARSGDRAAYDRASEKLLKLNKAARKLSKKEFDKEKIWNTVHNPPVKRIKDSFRVKFPDTKVSVTDSGVYFTTRIKGNKLEIYVTPNTTGFRVNGSYTLTPGMSDGEKYSITKSVRKQYQEIFKNLDDGAMLQVTAARGDGRADAREQAYERTGFSAPSGYGRGMYGMIRNGKMTPSDRSNFETYSRNPANRYALTGQITDTYLD